MKRVIRSNDVVEHNKKVPSAVRETSSFKNGYKYATRNISSRKNLMDRLGGLS